MNTLTQDLNDFIACRLVCAEAKTNAQVNEFADILKKTLNQEQADLLSYVLDFENKESSILEDCAYRQGFIDGLSMLSALKPEV